MRGKISDQDLTDYALNELEPADRLYLESMLAVSEECRNDVYNVIDLAQLIEDGFEREGGEVQVLCLRPEQRAELTRPHFTARYVLRDFASAIGLAACVAFALVQFEKFDAKDQGVTAGRVAQVTSKVSRTVTQVVQTPDAVDMKAAFENLRAMVSDPSNWLPVTEGMPEPPTICTPPTFVMESAQLTLGDMGQ